MINLLIDANIYLRFYSYAEDTFNELEKLAALIETHKICLYLPDQVKKEVSRHREAEISRGVDRFATSNFKIEIPQFARHFKESLDLLDRLKAASEAKAELTKKIQEEIQTANLRADELIRKLGESAITVDNTTDHVERARLRNAIGEPPGKRETLGDQIIWESMLDAVPNDNDFHIITNDGDYYSKLKPDCPHASLESEWKYLKKGNLYCYKSLSKFTQNHFPDIKLPIDAIKHDAISKLVNSTNFTTTHDNIEKLSNISNQLTFEDAAILFQAMVDNSQINWICMDSDVKSFYESLHGKFYSETSVELDEQLSAVADYFVSVPF